MKTCTVFIVSMLICLVCVSDVMAGASQTFLWSADTGIVNIGQRELLSSRGNDINGSGVIAGFYAVTYGHRRAAIWDPVTGLQDLGTLPGGDYSEAMAINDLGQVVGYSNSSRGYQGFLWDSANGIQWLGTLVGQDGYSAAVDINNSSQIVGKFDAVGGGRHACLWDPVSGVQDLGTLDGDSTARAINNLGQVTGVSNGQAFWWQSGSAMQGIYSGDGKDINNNGQVIIFGQQSGVWTSASGFQNIPELEEVLAINNSGQIAGTWRVPGASSPYAAFWDPNTGFVNIGTLGGDSGAAFGINDQGQVVGWSSTPEPATLGLVLIGGLALLRRRIR